MEPAVPLLEPVNIPQCHNSVCFILSLNFPVFLQITWWFSIQLLSCQLTPVHLMIPRLSFFVNFSFIVKHACQRYCMLACALFGLLVHAFIGGWHRQCATESQKVVRAPKTALAAGVFTYSEQACTAIQCTQGKSLLDYFQQSESTVSWRMKFMHVMFSQCQLQPVRKILRDSPKLIFFSNQGVFSLDVLLSQCILSLPLPPSDSQTLSVIIQIIK